VFWGNLAWAAAVAGQPRQFRQAADKVAEMVPRYDEYGAAACINVARGAWVLGDQTWPPPSQPRHCRWRLRSATGQTAAIAQRYGDAARVFALARRYAVAHGAAEREGDALRDLALVPQVQERDTEVLELVVQALAAYGPRTGCVQALARTWLAMLVDSGEYPGAVMLGTLLLSPSLFPADELAVCALLARAAAALGWELSYESFSLRAILSLGTDDVTSAVAYRTDYYVMKPGGTPSKTRVEGALAMNPRVSADGTIIMEDEIPDPATDACSSAVRVFSAPGLLLSRTPPKWTGACTYLLHGAASKPTGSKPVDRA
jgi:hypothetical protein